MLAEVIEAIDKGAILFPGEDIRDIVGYEGLYQVTSFGRVWGIKRQIWLRQSGGNRISIQFNGRLKFGYLKVNLSKDGNAVNKDVHLLVLKTFKEIPEYIKNQVVECRHIDGNKLNNNIDNLEWGTKSQNELDKIKHGTHNIGVQNGNAKLTEEQVLEIRNFYDRGIYSIGRMAQIYNVSGHTIWMAATRQNWKHV